ncbi:choice-of-anchor A family protein [Paenibacillus protaetiae]|uniref:Choice-of-anchor A family protein n=1 Tax=Paenibacillus protaetiae TaxID=2509456 RepID=A0A4P6EWH5_9BACL|nr:choice-of-anchor A family protein [Paenibacillus protaetiae]QAY67066.1 choice-of-anchor A family protein [Paenibacillus protaetiae]
MACINFSTANDFNVFLFSNFRLFNTSIGGRVAVGGNLDFQNQNVGVALPISTTRADLIVNGAISAVNGVNHGNTIISPTSVITAYTMTNRNNVPGQPFRDTLINFTEIQNYLQCASAGWGALVPNGTAAVAFNNITLTGTDPAFNIITLDGADVARSGVTLAGASSVNIVVPPDSTVLINVTGTSVGLGNYSVFVNGVTPSSPAAGSKIVWNFPQAAALTHGSGRYVGTILAPFAAISAAGSGELLGQLIGVSYTNFPFFTLTIVDALFTGCLPDITSCGGPSLTVTKTVEGASSFTGTPGTPIRYLVTVTNNGAIPVTNVTILDSKLGIQQSVPLIDTGESIPIVIDSEVEAGKAGTQYSNTVTVSGDQTAMISASVTITIAALPINIQLNKTASVASAVPGDQVIYTFTIVNLGNSDLLNVQLTDPAIGLSFSAPSFFEGVLTQTTFTIPAGFTAGTFENTARLTANNLPAPGFVESSESIEIVPSPIAASFRKSANVTSVLPGETIQYFFTIQNKSAGLLQSVELSDPLLDFTRQIAEISPNTTVVLNESFTVPNGTAAGTTIDNTAVLSGSFGSLTSSNTISVEGDSLLVLTKDENVEFVNPGDTIVYTIRAFNGGNTTLTDIVIFDDLAGFQTLIQSLPDGQSQDFATSVIVPQGTPSGTFITNVVVAQASGIPPVSSRVSAVVTDVPLPPAPPVPPSAPVIVVNGTVSSSTAIPGQTVTFRLEATNQSSTNARNLLLQVPLIHYTSVLEILGPGETFILSIEFTIPQGTDPGTLFTLTFIVSSITLSPQQISISVETLPFAQLSLTKTANQTEVVQGETVIFNVTGQNTGNVLLENIQFTDVAFQRESIIQRLSVGTIASSFFSTVVTETPGTVFSNTASATSNQIGKIIAADSYTVFGLLLHKQTRSSFVSIGDTIFYTVTLLNPMSIQAAGIVFRDPVSPAAAVVPGSVLLNGTPVNDSAIETGLPIPVLAPHASATVSFALKIQTEPAGGKLMNRAEASFIFAGATRQLSGTSFSNTVSVVVEEHEE